MSEVVNRHLIGADEAEMWRSPRHDLVEEHDPAEGPDGVWRFGLRRGPFARWERTVRVSPASEGRVEVTETVDWRLAVPFWWPLFVPAVRRHLRRPPDPDRRPPWWAPPQVLDARAATVLSLLCVVGAVAGYLGTLLTQTITYAAGQFGASTTDQGTLLAAVRVGVLLSLVVVAAADRRGRRLVLVASVVGSCLVTALGSLSPGMWWLGGTQTAARALSTVVALLIGIVAVEEMPAGSRAFAVSVLTMTAALGAGICVANLAYVDVAAGAWRVAYVVPLLAVYPCLRIGRRLPETRRFERSRLALGGASPEQARPEEATPAPPLGPSVLSAGVTQVGPPVPPVSSGPWHRHVDWRRFALLSASGFLWSLFLAPAAQFLNEFLRTERGFSGIEIALFVLATNTPGGIGIVVGGKLADRRGRRVVGALGIAGGVGFTVVAYLSWGWLLWGASVLAAIVGALAVPALAVYGPELFPTGQRGAANGGLQVISVAGSGVGLLLAGWLADRLGGLGPAMAILAAGPAVLVGLVLLLYPETARRELEELNPTDQPAADVGHPLGEERPDD